MFTKSLRFVLVFILIISFVNPLGSVYGLINGKESIADVKITSTAINKEAVMPVNVEQSSADDYTGKPNNLTYKFKPNVKLIPQSLDYKIEGTNTKDSIVGLKDPKLSGNTKAKTAIESKTKLAMNKPKLVIQKTNLDFKPQKGEIYVDLSKRQSFKVTENETSDSSGNTIVPIESAGLNEIFEYYKIPKQNIKLGKGNIAYMNPDVILQSNTEPHSSGMSSLARSTISHTVDIGGTYTYKFDDKTLFEYPIPKDANPETLTEEQKRASNLEQDQSKSNLDVLYNTDGSSSSFKASLKLKDCTVKVNDPDLEIYADLGLIETVGARLNSKIEVSGSLVGDIKFKKEIQIPVVGYIVDLEVGRAYVGVFIVIGIDGKITAKVDFVESGYASVGIAADFTPLLNLIDVRPSAAYTHDKIDAKFKINGRLELGVHVVPQIGIELFDINIAAVQIWAGLKGVATLEVSGEASEANGKADANVQTTLALDIDFETKLLAYVAGQELTNYNIIPVVHVYNDSWTFKTGSKGSDTPATVAGTNTITETEIPLKVEIMKNCVLRDTVKGRVTYPEQAFDVDDTPYTGEGVIVTVKRAETELEYPVKLDSDGYFLVPVQLFKGDVLWAKINKTVDGKTNSGNPKKDIFTGRSGNVKATVPYGFSELTADAFNGKIAGYIYGDPIGFDGITNTGDEAIYSGSIRVYHTKSDGTKLTYVGNVTGGKFEISQYHGKGLKLQSGDKLYAIIPFEQSPIESSEIEPTIDQLVIRAYYETNGQTTGMSTDQAQSNADKKEMVKVHGYVQNMNGEFPYEGRVYLNDQFSTQFSETNTVAITKTGYQTSIKADVNLGDSNRTAGNTSNNMEGNGIDLPEKKPVVPSTDMPNQLKEVQVKTAGSEFVFMPFEKNIYTDAVTAYITYNGISKAVFLGKSNLPDDNITFTVTQAPVEGKVSVVVNPSDSISSIANVVDIATTPKNLKTFRNINLRIGESNITVNRVQNSIDNGVATVPVINEGRTYLPIRAVVEALGGRITYESSTQMITLSLLDNDVKLWIGKNTVQINGLQSNTNAVPYISQTGRTMVPIRLAAESLGCKVDWDAKTQNITIYHPGEGSIDWSGTWYTNHGQLELMQEGRSVSGVTSEGLSFRGNLNGMRLVGNYTNKIKQTGAFEFTISEDGKAFAGNYGRKTEAKTNWLTVDGTRTLSQTTGVTVVNKANTAVIDNSKWLGIWFTNFGKMELKMDGNTVFGTYGEANNKMKGKISGKRFSGEYEEGDVKLLFYFDISEDGKILIGKYGSSQTAKEDWNVWNGKREGTSLDVENDKPTSIDILKKPTSKPTDIKSLWEGTWYTDYGRMDLTMIGNNVSGTYGEAKNTVKGSIAGNIFSGVYTEDDVIGLFYFEISEDGKTLTGKYGSDQSAKEDWNLWNGKRSLEE